MTRTSLIDLSAHLPEKVGEALCGIRDNSSGDIQGGGTCLSGFVHMDMVWSRDAQETGLQFKMVRLELMDNSRTQTEHAPSSSSSDHQNSEVKDF